MSLGHLGELLLGPSLRHRLLAFNAAHLLAISMSRRFKSAKALPNLLQLARQLKGRRASASCMAFGSDAPEVNT